MTIARVQTVLAGPQITGGGINTLYFFGSSGTEGAMVDAVRAFWAAVGGVMREGNTAQVINEVVNLDETTGNIVSVVPTGPATIVTADNDGDALPMQTQALVRWQTGGIVNNRRVRGRTFIPAQVEGNNTEEGMPTAGLTTIVTAAANGLVDNAATQLVVWSRPEAGRVGSQHPVLAGSAWNQWAGLRSRRD